jgi:para-nitrobenzyl esterase
LKPYKLKWVICFILLFSIHTIQAQELRHVQVHTADGIVEGVVSADNKVRTFKGIPYAAPPVGALRWKAPQPVQSWPGVLKTIEYQKRAMQGPIYSDMIFHDDGPGEDCLYLNLWMPENHPEQEKLPVMVWIHGGGFIAGSSSEPRQDAGNLSKKGVLIVSLNYRLGIFGFFSLPGLTKESGHNASGNYGLMDQIAALQWVKNNIADFGGDPHNVTVFGESAGSASVSALMASPLAKGLFQKAIGESGALFGTREPPKTRLQTEEEDVKFADSAFDTSSLEALRAVPAQQLLDAALKKPNNFFRPNIDGYFLPADCRSVYKSGKQAHVPLLAGWNKDEGDYRSFFGKEDPTKENYVNIAREKFGNKSKKFLQLYPAMTDSEAKRSAQDFQGDMFTGYATWKWIEMQLATGESPVYRYKFEQPLPLPADAKPGTEPRVPHASEIEYVFTVLFSKKLPWTKEDYKVSDVISSYWTNFAKTGNPNGPGLAVWPEYNSKNDYPVMHINPDPVSSPDANQGRYKFIEAINSSR